MPIWFFVFNNVIVWAPYWIDIIFIHWKSFTLDSIALKTHALYNHENKHKQTLHGYLYGFKVLLDVPCKTLYSLLKTICYVCSYLAYNCAHAKLSSPRMPCIPIIKKPTGLVLSISSWSWRHNPTASCEVTPSSCNCCEKACPWRPGSPAANTPWMGFL